MNHHAPAVMTVLVAEDEDNDFYLFQRAFERADPEIRLHRARDGLEAVHYLKGEGEFADRDRFPVPQIVLLDLKMPRMTGIEVLEWIKENPRYHVTPTLVVSSSVQPPDVQMAYEYGANTYFQKPIKFEGLVELCRLITGYWRHGIKPRID